MTASVRGRFVRAPGACGLPLQLVTWIRSAGAEHSLSQVFRWLVTLPLGFSTCPTSVERVATI